jgi:peptidoglycan/xylan/chitin deacetylase (PgdA/CDA1 family)
MFLGGCLPDFLLLILPCIYNPTMLGLALGAAVAVGAGATGYQSIAPTGQWFGRAFYGLPFESGQRRSKQIALTFDDGPNDPHTLRLLDVLARYNVHAMFFMIGRYVRQRPEIALEVHKQGHVVGNHTFTHPLLTVKSMKHIRSEITQCHLTLTDVVGEHSNLFRPPWGGRRPGVFRLVRHLGLEPIMWNVTGYDWNAPSADYIEQKVTRRVCGGDVILLHDGGHLNFGTDRSKTVEVVDRMISRYQGEGYQFVTVPEMMHQSPEQPE